MKGRTEEKRIEYNNTKKYKPNFIEKKRLKPYLI